MSGERGVLRKVYDISPAAFTSNGNFDGGGTPTTAYTSGIAPNGVPGWVSAIPQAITDNGRVGISVALESLDIRWKITPQPTVIGYSHARVILFSDNECDGTQPTVQELLGDANNTAYTVANGAEMAFLNPSYFGRFNIIEDKNYMWYTSSTANSFTEQAIHNSYYHEAHHDMKGHRVMWDVSDGNAITNARKGHIFLLVIYSNTVTSVGGLPTVTTANPPTFQYALRYRYRDA